MSPANQIAHFKKDDQILTGKILEYHPFKHGATYQENIPAKIVVELDPTLSGEGRIEMSPFDCTIEIPIEGSGWEQILHHNQAVPGIENIGVKVEPQPGQPIRTTLFNRLTLEELEYTIESTESGTVKLTQGNEQPYEGKPSLQESHTVYAIGEIELEMDATRFV